MTGTKKLLIFCEGQTEVNYLGEWADECKVRAQVKITRCQHNEPYLMLKEAVKEFLWAEKMNEPYFEVWIVYDRDEHETFHQAVETAKLFPYLHLCWTNPCIEAWFLMHFTMLPNLPRSQKVVIDREENYIDGQPHLEKIVTTVELVVNPQYMFDSLKRKWQEYSKTSSKYLKTLRSKMDLALEQCTQTDLHQDVFAFGSLMPEVLTAIAKLATQDEMAAEEFVGHKWFEYCEQKRLEAQLISPINDQH